MELYAELDLHSRDTYIGFMDAGYSSAHLARSYRTEVGHANYLIIYKKNSINNDSKNFS
jgi:hypothetical protein